MTLRRFLRGKHLRPGNFSIVSGEAQINWQDQASVSGKLAAQRRHLGIYQAKVEAIDEKAG